METTDKVVSKVIHDWCEKDDRWIYVEYNSEHEVIGMNFMQGNEYENFKKKWCHNDEALTEFWRLMLYTFPIERASIDALTFINKCMTAYSLANEGW